MKKTPHSSTAIASLILKITGTIMVLGVLVDAIVAAIPADFLNSEWLVDVISVWVGRGTIPLIGLSLILFGVWVGRSEASRRSTAGSSWIGGTQILAGLLAFLFLVLAPLYFLNNQRASAAETRRLNEDAAIAEQELNAQLTQQRDQVSALLSNPEAVDELQQQLRSADQLSEDEREFLANVQKTLEEVESNPGALDQKVEEARQEGIEAINAQLEQSQEEVVIKNRRARIWITVNSLLLSAGYSVIAGGGWLTSRQGGLQGSSKRKSKQRKARTR